MYFWTVRITPAATLQRLTVPLQFHSSAALDRLISFTASHRGCSGPIDQTVFSFTARPLWAVLPNYIRYAI